MTDGFTVLDTAEAFDFQMLEQVPCETVDYPLDYIATETKLLERMSGK